MAKQIAWMELCVLCGQVLDLVNEETLCENVGYGFIRCVHKSCSERRKARNK